MGFSLVGSITGTGSPNYLGGISDLKVVGNYAYVVSEDDDAFVIINISTPSSPTKVASLVGAGNAGNYLGGACSVAVSGNYAYVAAPDDNCITVIDISTPASPTRVHRWADSHLSNAPQKVVVSGNYIYVGTLANFVIGDITTPTSISYVDYYSVLGITSIALDGNAAFIGGTHGIYCLNISTPSDITFSDFVGVVSGIKDISIDSASSYLYCNQYTEVGSPPEGFSIIEIYDISNTTNITRVSFFSGSGFPQYIDDVSGLVVQGGYLYICSGSSSNALVCFSNAHLPNSIGLVGILFNASISDSKIQVVSDYAYITAGNSLLIVSVADKNPLVPFYTDYTSVSYSKDVVVYNNYAFVAEYNKLTSWNISDPSNMISVSSLSGFGICYGIDISEDGNYIYLASSTYSKLYIVDVSNPAVMVTKGSSGSVGSPMYTGGASDVAVIDSNYVCVVSLNDNAFTIFNVTTPTSPSAMGVVTGISYLNQPSKVFVQGNYAYIASTGYDTLVIINITDKNNPVVASRTTGSGSEPYLGGIKDVVVSGDYAYVVATDDEAFSIFNISNPVSPSVVSTLLDGDFPDWFDRPHSVLVTGNYAIVQSTNKLISLISVTNPSSPEVRGVYAGFPLIQDGNGSICKGEESEYLYAVTASLFAIINTTIFSVSRVLYADVIKRVEDIDTSYSAQIKIVYDIDYQADVYNIRFDIPCPYYAEAIVRGTSDIFHEADIYTAMELYVYAEAYSVQEDVNHSYQAEAHIVIIENIFHSAQVDLKEEINQSYYSDIQLNQSRVFYGDIRLSEGTYTSLPAIIKVGFSQNYFIVKQGKESKPSSVYWAVVYENKESNPLSFNYMTVEYLKNLPVKLYVNNAPPTGGIVINMKSTCSVSSLADCMLN